jgi:hypothetical protein
MTDISNITFPRLLREQIPGFDRIYDEHVHDNDDVLPHLLLGDLVRFLSDEVHRYGDGCAALGPAMDLLEQGMTSTDPKVQELVAVSFLENLDPQDPSFPAIARLFGPGLREQYDKYLVDSGNAGGE